MNVEFSNVNTYSYSSSYKNITTQRISKPSEAELQSSQKVLGYEVDENGYFKSDFNKAAGIPEDFKIHSDTMKSLVNMNENAGYFYHSFSDLDIAKTAGNAYKILTQLVDEDTLSKNKFTNEDIAKMPQGYKYNSMTMKVTEINQTVEDYMVARGDTLAENHDVTSTFHNSSTIQYYLYSKQLKSTNTREMFTNNIGGKEGKAGLYFNSHGEKYTNSDGSVTKGGLLVGIMNENFHTRDGKTTWQGKLMGMDKQVSFKEAQLQSKLFSMMYPRIDKVPDSVIESLPEDMSEYMKNYKKNFRVTNGHFSDVGDNDKAKEYKSPGEILFEQMQEEQKDMLERLQKKAREAKLEEQEAELKKQEKLLEELRKKSQESLNDFTDHFLHVQEKINRVNSLQNQVNITENELKTAFLGMFDFSKNEFEKKSFLDLTA